MPTTPALTKSLEDYLKSIVRIIDDKGAARAKDISERMEVNMSSVTGALHSLAERGLVNYAPYELITLTQEGTAAARDVVRRHEGICDFLVKVLAVDAELAEKAACEMEHAVTPEILERIIQFTDYLEMCPRVGARFLDEFGYHCVHPDHDDDCEQCLAVSLEDFKNKKSLAESERVRPLSDLPVGSRAKIVHVGGNGEIRRRIVDMGVTPGSMIEIERVAPLGDPMEVKVRGYHLSLRMEEARTVKVEPF